MIEQTIKAENQVWIEIMYNPTTRLIQDITDNWKEYKKLFIDQIAENIYNDIQRTKHVFKSRFTFKTEFADMPEEEKRFWFEYAGGIPSRLKFLNLRIRRYKDFCRTCLIPYSDVEKLAIADFANECRTSANEDYSNKDQDFFSQHFRDLPDNRKLFYLEMVHLVPVELRKAGYELVRPEEIAKIGDRMVLKLARAIHSRYRHEVTKQSASSQKKTYFNWLHSPGNNLNTGDTDFESLPEEIKHSNLDNAFHIPTKLLAIGYNIRPVERGYKPATLNLSEEEIEVMAKIEHIRWCWDKILHGWFHGEIKDPKKKFHPSIIAYEELSEAEKEKDRELVRMIPALLKDIGYEAYPVNPDRTGKVPYAIKPHSSMHRILDETRQINTYLKDVVRLSPDLEEMVDSRNLKIEEAIREVESSYKYALHIQESFLPDNLYVRECFPDSFILFMPKDVVSGDFYFFSRQKNQIIFAAADCTGHGIPGALLSTIGYGILDQAVNEIKLNDPVKILHHLYSKIHRFLRLESDGSGIADDMDIILCKLDTKTCMLTYSGVRNSLFHIRNGTINEYRTSSLPPDGSNIVDNLFISSRIQLNGGDTIYLCSDGYTDQFGGKSHKKYQSTRFKNFLLSIHEKPMSEQNDFLYEEIERWREENNEDQTDDILVIGIRL